jgi:hypothetical protein
MNERRLGILGRGVLALVLTLAACRSSLAQGVVSLNSPETDAAEARILRSLETPVSVEFEDRPLIEVIQYFSGSMGVSMRIDERSLEDASIAADTPVSCDFQSITLRSALRSMLGRLDLTYVIKNEMLIVTTPEKAGNELITRVYLVRDLVVQVSGDRSYHAYQQLIDLVTATIAPTTWDEVGGPGAIHEFRPAMAVVISQTREVHEQVVELLESVRRARDIQHVPYDSGSVPRTGRPLSAPVQAEFIEPARYVLQSEAGWSIPRVHE